MGAELCLLKSAALAVINEPSDLLIMSAFLFASILELRGQPVFIHVVLCNIAWILTANYAPETYWLLCFISSTYVCEYYYKLKSWTAIPVALLSLLTLIMGLGTLFEYVGWYGFYDALYNRHEVSITGIYCAILLSLVDWRGFLSALVDIISNVRIGQSGVNRVFGLL